MNVTRSAWKTGLVGAALSAVLAGGLWSGSQGAATALAAPGVRASSAVPPNRQTAVQIVNMGSSNATLQMQFYSQTQGPITYNNPAVQGATLAPGQSINVDQRFDNSMPSPFVGAGIALANQRLAGIVSEFAGDGGFDFYNALGNDAVANTAICPIVVKRAGGQVVSSIVNIQNAGTGANSGTLVFRDLNGNAIGAANTNFGPLNAGMSVSFVLEDLGGLQNGFVGSVEVNGSQAVAVAVEQYSVGVLLDYSCPSAGATELNAPSVYKVDNVLGTSTVVANFGSAAATVDFTFSEAAASPRNLPTFTKTIPAKSMLFVDQRFDNGGNPLPSNWIGKVNIKSTNSQPIAAIVEGLDYVGVVAAAYSGIPIGQNATTVVLPNIFRNVSTNPTVNTGFQVDNPNGAAASITVTYTPSGGGAAVVSQFSIAANSARNFDLRVAPDSAIVGTSSPTQGSITITSNVPVSAIVNYFPNVGQNLPQFKDTLASYNAVAAS
jgi:hypothetical protein